MQCRPREPQPDSGEGQPRPRAQVTPVDHWLQSAPDQPQSPMDTHEELSFPTGCFQKRSTAEKSPEGDWGSQGALLLRSHLGRRATCDVAADGRTLLAPPGHSGSQAQPWKAQPMGILPKSQLNANIPALSLQPLL